MMTKDEALKMAIATGITIELSIYLCLIFAISFPIILMYSKLWFGIVDLLWSI